MSVKMFSWWDDNEPKSLNEFISDVQVVDIKYNIVEKEGHIKHIALVMYKD